jgi:hypothetical protein
MVGEETCSGTGEEGMGMVGEVICTSMGVEEMVMVVEETCMIGWWRGWRWRGRDL